MIRELTQFQFKALLHSPRPAFFDYLVEEHEWYSDESQDTLGVLFLDKSDRDWGYVVLKTDSQSVFRAVGLELSVGVKNDAREKLLARVEQASEDSKQLVGVNARSHLPARSTLVDPFDPVVRPAKLNPMFRLVSSHDGYSPARGMIREVFGSYVDRDGNFVEQLQTTGFDARIWELYLYAYLVNSGFMFQPSVSPDYVVSKHGVTVAIEAVTANPTRGPHEVGSKPTYSSTRIWTPIKTSLLNRLGHGFEYKQEDFVPIKLGSALYSKLQKRYWQSADLESIRFILAIETFHDEAALHYSSSALATYLYGFRHPYLYDSEGKLLIVPRKIESHSFAGKSIPSGFFFLPEAENISAVLFSNSGTISKFNRMGQQGDYYNPRISLVRIGTCVNFDIDATTPDTFRYKVGDPDFPEWWGQGLEMFHNPRATHPVDRDLFPEITHHRVDNGLVYTDGPSFQPYASITINFLTNSV